MQDVPQFALKRLQETRPDADSHPDPDLLTAFAERALAGGERFRVMEHLAACGDCRDVVALALPETEIIASPASVSGARIGWFRLPALRWGVLAAGILVVASVGVRQYSQRGQEKTVALNRMQSGAAPAPSAFAASAPATAPQSETRGKALAATDSKILSAHKAAREASRGGAIHGSVVASAGVGSGGGVSLGADAAFAQAPQSLGSQALPPTPGSQPQILVGRSSEVVEVEASAAPIATDSAASQNQLAQNQTDLPLNGRNVSDLTSLDVVKAKDPVPAQAASGAAPGPALAAPSPLQTSPALMLHASARWTVSSSGVLQRSFDGGNTWENVNPAMSGSSAGGRVAMESTAKTAARFGGATPNQDKQAETGEAVPTPAPVFRAVAAAGLEVWAGGSGGALYHTSDGGNRWTRVAPSAAGALLAGDIIGIQFSDAQHGKVSTSTGEIWITSDAGQTWHKQ